MDFYKHFHQFSKTSRALAYKIKYFHVKKLICCFGNQENNSCVIHPSCNGQWIRSSKVPDRCSVVVGGRGRIFCDLILVAGIILPLYLALGLPLLMKWIGILLMWIWTKIKSLGWKYSKTSLLVMPCHICFQSQPEPECTETWKDLVNCQALTDKSKLALIWG